MHFPEPKDLDVPFADRIGDGRPKVFQMYDVSNPHPGFGKDPNILNEFGHTKYPMFVGSVIVNNEAEEKAARNPIAAEGVADPAAATKLAVDIVSQKNGW